MTSYNVNDSNVIDIVEQINDFLFYNQEFKIIICSLCHICINNQTNNFDYYFNNNIQHKTLKSNEKKQLNKFLKKYNVALLNNVQIPANNQHFFSYLYVYNDVFQCQKCEKLLRNEKEMQNHLNQIHNIKNKSKNDENFYNSNLNAQLLFSGKNKEYFLVSFKNQNIININNDDINNNNENS